MAEAVSGEVSPAAAADETAQSLSVHVPSTNVLTAAFCFEILQSLMRRLRTTDCKHSFAFQCQCVYLCTHGEDTAIQFCRDDEESCFFKEDAG